MFQTNNQIFTNLAVGSPIFLVNFQWLFIKSLSFHTKRWFKHFSSISVDQIFTHITGWWTILKNMKVNGKDDIPYEMEKMSETTNHIKPH